MLTCHGSAESETEEDSRIVRGFFFYDTKKSTPPGLGIPGTNCIESEIKSRSEQPGKRI
jgi:hypothetical protein